MTVLQNSIPPNIQQKFNNSCLIPVIYGTVITERIYDRTVV